MPISWTAIFRMIVVLVVALHVFCMYGLARAEQEVVGLSAATVLASASFALVMLVPLSWAVALPDLPVIFRAEAGRRRWRAGRCPRCAHWLIAVEGESCPECGAERREPTSFPLGWGTVRRFALLALAAWVVGCAAGESWAALDEAAFAREAQARLAAAAGTDLYTRPRRWPMEGASLYYTPVDGVTAYSPRFLMPESAAPVTARQRVESRAE